MLRWSANISFRMEVKYLILRLDNLASRCHPHPRDLRPTHRGGEGDEPVHQRKHGGIFVWKILQQSPRLLLLHLLQLDQGVEPGDDDIALTKSQMKRAVELGESLPGPLGHLIISATTSAGRRESSEQTLSLPPSDNSWQPGESRRHPTGTA